MKNQSSPNRREYIASWQVRKMQSIIKDRWSEVWEFVQAREIEQKGLKEFTNQAQSD